MASLPVNPGHEAIVRKSYLLAQAQAQRPRGQSQPMPHVEPESAIERDQRIGLVRNHYYFLFVFFDAHMRLFTCAAYQRPLDRLTERH